MCQLVYDPHYMEQRKNGLEVGSVCESCKGFAPPFALRLGRDLEAGGYAG